MKRVSTLIEDAIEAGATLVVPSGPRAAACLRAHARSQLESGRSAWRTPDVIAWRAWLEREAHHAADAGLVTARPLRAAEEWLLWREAAASAARAEGFDAPEGLADSLRSAARVLTDWEIPPAALRHSTRAESRVFLRALETFEARARDLRAAGSHELARLLKRSRLGRPVAFAGFTHMTAARRALMQAWSSAGGRCRELVMSDDPAKREDGCGEPRSVRLLRAADPMDELAIAAEWCRDRLQSNPAARLLVIAPGLAGSRPEDRTEALRVFRKQIAPQAALLASAEDTPFLALEDGFPLDAEPLIRHALATLGFLIGGAEMPELSAWLRAAFWNTPSAIERARLDAALRESLGVEATPARLIDALRGARGALQDAAERLRAMLCGALDAFGCGTLPHDAERIGESASLGEWARRFERALGAFEWPGARPLSAREELAAARFAEALDDLAAIGSQTGACDARAALQWLNALVRRRTLSFAPDDAPVTLASALDDPIVRYDGIWLAGLHAEAWPPAAGPDPFIPIAAQREAGVPAADASQWLLYAREVLQRCRRAAADEWIVSWPARTAERDHSPSPLLAEIAGPFELLAPDAGSQRAHAGSPRAHASLDRLIRASRRIETYEDTRGEPWPAPSPLPSGTRAIEYQSLCPFRAYAELRLMCVPLDVPQPGIGAFGRGRLLHRALELLWGRLGGSDGLDAASRAGTLGELIEECVMRAAIEILPVPYEASARAAQRRERRRAVQLLAELAELERQRAPFRVLSTEVRRRIVLGGAVLDVRIDRIDELADRSCAVFDYKTGHPAPVDWLEERVANPQLMVYAFAAEAPVSALAMIQLTPRRVGYRGMADRRDRLPKVAAAADASQWPQQMARWGERLARLAGGFLEGAAAVDPLRDACETCHLHGLCRIMEIDQAAGAEP